MLTLPNAHEEPALRVLHHCRHADADLGALCGHGYLTYFLEEAGL
jgi:hypothetical protein